MKTAISIQEITKTYPDFKLNKVSFNLQKGTIMGLIGENGAGKSTIIKLLLNELKKESGEIRIFGKTLEKHEKEIKEDIGVVFDECNFYENFYIKDLNNVYKQIYANWDSAIYDTYIKRFELPLKKKIKNFSKGMKMKLGFAVALSHHPKLLILDEATSGLDPIMRDEILDILQEFIQNENHSVLISSHILSDLEKVADYITFIHKGTILISETKDTLIYDYGIIHCGNNIFESLDKQSIVAYKKEAFEWKVLVSNKQEFRKIYPDVVIDHATIEDIMLFHIKGERV